MLTKDKNRINSPKSYIAIALIIGFFTLLSCNENLVSPTGNVEAIHSIPPPPPPVLAAPDENGIFTIVSDPAMPEGGYENFYRFIAANLQYPIEARKMGIEGRVFAQFVINDEGKITDLKIVKGIGAGCDEEVVRVMSLAPAWIPAKHEGQIVKQRIVLPVTFSLGKENKVAETQEVEIHMQDEEDVFVNVDNPAMPSGGYEEFFKYVASNLKYPKDARKNNAEGRVFIQFTVDTDGSIIDAIPVKGIGYGCDEEAQRIVANSPQWSAAKIDGKPVKQRIILPITFKLD